MRYVLVGGPGARLDGPACAVPRELIERITAGAPGIAVAAPVTRAWGRRRRTPEHEIQDLSAQDAPAQLAALLLSLARDYGEPQDRGVRLTLRLTHHDLASMTGVRQDAVTTLIRRFRARGLIGVAQRGLLIVDRDRLRRLALRATR